LDSLSTAQTVGGTHRGNKQYNTILQSRQHSNIPPTQVQRSDSATYQPRLCTLGCASSVLFPFLLSHSLFYIPAVSLSTRRSLYPPPLSPSRCLSRTYPLVFATIVPIAAFRSSSRLRSIAVPSPFHLVERLYLIGWIINHR